MGRGRIGNTHGGWWSSHLCPTFSQPWQVSKASVSGPSSLGLTCTSSVGPTPVFCALGPSFPLCHLGSQLPFLYIPSSLGARFCLLAFLFPQLTVSWCFSSTNYSWQL